MHHLYLPIHGNESALLQEREELVAWCEKHGVGEYRWIEDDLRIGRIQERQILQLIDAVRPGDVVVAADISRLGRSLPMLETVLTEFCRRDVKVESIIGIKLEPGPQMRQFVQALSCVASIERQMKARRSSQVLYEKREEGVQIGRPRGARKSAAKSVLFGKEEQLRQMHAQGASPTQIADALGVSRGTVYNFLKEETARSQS